MKTRFPIVPHLAFALLLAFGAHAPSRASAAAPHRAPAHPVTSADAKAAPVDINTASAPDLETVPGIGHALAQRIVSFRDKNGAFESVDDLLKVQGIGEKSLGKLRPYVTVLKTK